MQPSPKISVIIPVYNVEQYIDKCINSIINQTLLDIEIIVIDDRGNDGSMRIAQNYANQYSNIKIIRHDKNSGLSAARNTGIANAAAPFIMFCDSDDWYAPDMCEKMLNAIENNNADLAICGIEMHYEADKKMKKSDDRYYKICFSGLQPADPKIFVKTSVSPCNKIYRTDIIRKNNITFPVGLNYEDEYFCNAYYFYINTIYFIKDKLYNYRRRAGSILNQTFACVPGKSINIIKIAILLNDTLKKSNKWDDYKYFIYGKFFSFVDYALRYEKTDAGKQNIYDLAIKFIRDENWLPSDFPERSPRNFIFLCTRELQGRSESHLKGIIKCSENVWQKKLMFLNIVIWQTIYESHRHNNYLFGFIHIYPDLWLFIPCILISFIPLRGLRRHICGKICK